MVSSKVSILPRPGIVYQSVKLCAILVLLSMVRILKVRGHRFAVLAAWYLGDLSWNQSKWQFFAAGDIARRRKTVRHVDGSVAPSRAQSVRFPQLPCCG